jgi:antitoxin VapB
MGVQLNIKDPETIRLARELSAAKGESITATIRQALEREQALREADVEARVARIKAVAAEFRRNMPPEWHGKTSKEIMDEIYDEHGLPIR